MKGNKCPVCGRALIDGATLCLHCLEPLTGKTEVASARIPGRRMKAALAASCILFASALVVIVLLFGASSKSPSPAATESIKESVSATSGRSSAKTAAVTSGVTDRSDGTESASGSESREEISPSEDMSEPDLTPQTESVSNTDTPAVTTAAKTGAVTTGAKTAAATESVSVHVHTPACYTKVIDVPYRAAVYYTEDVYEGGNNVTVTAYYVSLYDIGREDVTVYSFNFGSESEYLEWKNENASNMGEYFDGERTVSYIVYEGKMYEYGVWTHEETGHGPVLLHRRGDLKEPEVKEVSHYELTCGYE